MNFLYIARRHCGCITAAVFDDPVSQEETAIDVADFIRSGRTVERVEAKAFDLGHMVCSHLGTDPAAHVVPKGPDTEVRGDSLLQTLRDIRAELNSVTHPIVFRMERIETLVDDVLTKAEDRNAK